MASSSRAAPLKTISALEKEKNAEKLAAFIAELDGEEVHIADITVDSVNDLAYTVDRFLKECNVLKSYAQQRVLNKLIQFAASTSEIDRAEQLTARTLLFLVRWVKSDKGQREIKRILNYEKLRSKGAGKRTPEDVGWINLLDAAKTDFANEVTVVRRQFDEELLELKRRVDEKTYELEEAIRAKRREYGAIVLQKKPDSQEFSERAELMYKKYCDDNGVALPESRDEILKRSAEMFQDDLLAQAKLELCKQPGVKEFLSSYCLDKIRNFRALRDRRGEQTYSGWYTITSGEVLTEDRIRQEVADVEEYPVGDVADRTRESGGQTAINNLFTEVFGEQAGGREQTEAQPAPPTREIRATTEAAERKRKGKGVAAGPSRRSQRYRDRA